MILIIRVDGECCAYSARDSLEAAEKLLQLSRIGAEVDYWQLFPEGKNLGGMPTRKT